MNEEKFKEALKAIDNYNSKDPNIEKFADQEFPKELLYGRRMSKMLCEFNPDASEALRIAVRCQHIGRWELSRDSYSKDRVGYLKWRNEQKKRHANIAKEILEGLGYEEDIVNRVMFLVEKKQLKTDEETQTLEDVVCLVFLEYYFDDFAMDHEKEKVIEILQKTWEKMSDSAKAFSEKLKLSDNTKAFVNEALT